MLIGSHVGHDDPIATAASDKADCVQVFLSDPQGWKAPKPRADAEALKTSGLPIYVHAPYLVNVVSANNRIRVPSRRILQDTCTAAAAIGAAGVIVHGGHVGDASEVEDGFGRWRKALQVLESEVPVFLENTAGGGHAMTRQFETIARLWDTIGDLDPGFCLDTCHAHASGEALETAVDNVLAATGRIDLVHCNDSKDPAGSGRDRHTHLGEGEIDPELLVEVVRSAGAPVVIETEPGGRAADVAWLRARV